MGAKSRAFDAVIERCRLARRLKSSRETVYQANLLFETEIRLIRRLEFEDALAQIVEFGDQLRQANVPFHAVGSAVHLSFSYFLESRKSIRFSSRVLIKLPRFLSSQNLAPVEQFSQTLTGIFRRPLDRRLTGLDTGHATQQAIPSLTETFHAPCQTDHLFSTRSKRPALKT